MDPVKPKDGPIPPDQKTTSTFTYPTFMSDLKTHRERIGYSYADISKNLQYFNISRLPDVDNATEPYIAYILMSRPDLNITSGAGGIWGKNIGTTTSQQNLETIKNMAMTAAYANDKYGEMMLYQLSRANSNIWLPVITTRSKNFNVNDAELKQVEKGLTFFGHKIIYGKHSEDHKIGGSFTLEFRNDRQLSILKMMQLWVSYIYNVSKNDWIVPDENYQRNGILDYCGSLYYLVTRRDGRELVYWEKLTGVFPTRVPWSMFSTTDQMIVEDNVSIDFTYSIRSDPCDPSVLNDINFLSGDSYEAMQQKMAIGWTTPSVLDNEVWQNNKEYPFVKGDVWATNPYIVRHVDNTGCMKYYLTWENKTNPNINKSDNYIQAANAMRNLGMDPDQIQKNIDKAFKNTLDGVIDPLKKMFNTTSRT